MIILTGVKSTSMRTRALLFILVALPILTFGQKDVNKVDVTSGARFEERTTKKIWYVIGSNELGVYSVFSDYEGPKGKTGLFISRTGNKLNKEVEVVYDNNLNGSNYYFAKAFMFNDRLLVLSFYRDTEAMELKLYLREMDLISLDWIYDPIWIGTLDIKGLDDWFRPDFGIGVSSNDSMLLVYYDISDEKGEPKRMGFHVVDQDLDLEWYRDVSLPYANEQVYVTDYLLSNDGEVFAMGKVYEDRQRNVKKGSGNFSFHVMSFTSKSSEDQFFKISGKEHYLADMKFAIGQDNDLICAGYYSNKEMQFIEGVFYIVLEQNSGAIIDEHYNEYSSLDFNSQPSLNNNVQEKQVSGKKPELERFRLNTLLTQENGDVYLVGEQFDIKAGDPPVYHYNDIIIVKYDEDGVVKWAQKVRKKQQVYDDGNYFSSFTCRLHNDNLYLVFNDHSKNLHYKGEGRYWVYESDHHRMKEYLIVMVEIDTDGSQSKRRVFTAKEHEVVKWPRLNETTDSNEIVFYGKRLAVHRFGKITFK